MGVGLSRFVNEFVRLELGHGPASARTQNTSSSPSNRQFDYENEEEDEDERFARASTKSTDTYRVQRCAKEAALKKYRPIGRCISLASHVDGARLQPELRSSPVAG